MHNKENPVSRQRRLHFEDDELWTMLPEPVQERCRTSLEGTNGERSEEG